MTANLTLLDLLDRLPAPSHRNDRDTSVAAAESLRGVTGRQMRLVLMALYAVPDGLTDEECAVRCGIERTWAAATRRGSLVREGLVEATEARRFTSSGRKAIVWRLTADGRRLASELARSW